MIIVSEKDTFQTVTPEAATDAWYEHAGGHQDTPRVSVWFPTSLPYGRLETRTVGGHHGKDVLPMGKTLAHVTISGIDFGGYLDDLEMMFRSVDEQIQRLRYIESELRELCTVCGEMNHSADWKHGPSDVV